MRETETEYIDDDDEKGLSFGDICKRIWHAKAALGITTVCVFAVCALAIQYGYTRSKSDYTTNVTYTFPGATDGKYPNSTIFDYRDQVSSTVLKKVKSSSDEFSSIDVDAMVRKGDVSVTKIKTTSTVNGSETITTAPNYVTFTFSAKYFSSYEQCKDFVVALTNLPIDEANSEYSALGYTTYLTSYQSAEKYSDQISYLSAQYNLLNDNYKNLIATYVDCSLNLPEVSSSVSNSGTDLKISDYQSLLTSYFKNNSISTLSGVLETKGYVKDAAKNKTDIENAIYQTQLQLDKDNDELTSLQAQFKALYSSISTSTDSYIISSSTAFADKIAALTTEINNLTYDLKSYNKQLDNINNSTYEAPASFTDTLTLYYNKLSDFTTVYTEVSTAVYKNNTTLTYDDSSVVTASGGLSLAINLVVSLLVGLIVGCIVSGVKGNNDMKREALLASGPKASNKPEDENVSSQPKEEKKPKGKNK